MSDLSDRLARLARRGNNRGADAVFAAAQADASTQPTPARARSVRPMPARKLTVITAIAASVTLLGGVAAAVRLNTGSDAPQKPTTVAVATTTSEPTSTTTTAPVEPTSRVYLASTRLVPFDKCPTLTRYAQTKALEVVGPYGLPGTAQGGRASAAVGAPNAAERSPTAPAAPSAPAAPVAADDAFSTTNVQEAGIDEPDSVKTDGKTIYAVANGKVFATAADSNPRVVGSVLVDGARDLLLVGTRLIVLSDGGPNVYGGGPRPAAAGSAIAPYPYRASPSRFSVFDVTNPAAMKLSGSFDVDGSYVSARLVDGVARIVVRSSPALEFTYPQDNTPEAQAASEQHNRDVIRSTTVDSWLPHFAVTNASGDQIANAVLSTCADSYRPPTFAGFGMLSVISFNAANPADSHSTSVMADGDIVYGSATRLYVATNSWGQVTDQTVQPSSSTLVHAFDISDPLNAKYLVSGRVRGTVLNQFAMSEYNAALRIATTDAAGGSESLITILGNAGDALVPIGQVSGLGRGERIYAVRFIDAVAYVVTFRQVDPLYVVDLADPSHPRVVGELALTGYSAYLHPIAPGLLLGIGQEATTDGHRVGIQASIFDVSSPAAPKLVARKVLEQGSSSAEFDHHAFLYWPATKLAVLPISTYTEQNQFNGAVGLRIGATSIDEVGRIQPPASDSYGSPGVQRTLVIGNRLYATSYTGVLVNALDTLTQTAWVAYPTS